jgi:hypothetical protein
MARNRHEIETATGNESDIQQEDVASALAIRCAEELIEVGQTKVGVIPKLWCIAATADDEHNVTWPCWYAEKARPWLNC